MAEIVVFDGRFKRRLAATAKPQVAVNQWYSARILRSFFELEQSAERIARREGVGTLEIQRIIRENARPHQPAPALRRAA